MLCVIDFHAIMHACRIHGFTASKKSLAYVEGAVHSGLQGVPHKACAVTSCLTQRTISNTYTAWHACNPTREKRVESGPKRPKTALLPH
eukprot:359936-Chlamydomonas_euryale.AAC.10